MVMPSHIQPDDAGGSKSTDQSLSALSLGERLWQPRLTEEGELEAVSLAKKFDISLSLASICASRGVKEDTCEAYLQPRLKNHFSDLLKMRHLATAAELLIGAISQRQKIAIIGDYDVDGAASAALLTRFLRCFDIEPYVIIPDREVDGYGPNVGAVRDIVDRRYQMLICVDCGSTAGEPLAIAHEANLTTLVLDHHRCGGEISPVDAFVNPNHPDDSSGQGYLCGAGVVFAVLAAASSKIKDFEAGDDRHSLGAKLPDLMQWLDLLAVATIADVVPLVGNNRAIVSQGLRQLPHTKNEGMRQLLSLIGGNRVIDAGFVGFQLGPVLNAGGRLGQSMLSFQLLTCDDAVQAGELAEQANQLNLERRKVLSEAVSLIVDNDVTLTTGGEPIVIASDKWKSGFNGVIASRLADRYKRAVFVFSKNQSTGLLSGSARSAGNVNVGAVIEQAVELGFAIKGGGHNAAGGLQLEASGLDNFKDFLRGTKSSHAQAKLHHGLFDRLISLSSIEFDFYDEVSRAAPHGNGNPKPIFIVPDCQIAFYKVVGEDHLRLTVVDPSQVRKTVMAFGKAKDERFFALRRREERFTLAIEIGKSYYMERARLDLRLVDALPSNAAALG